MFLILQSYCRVLHRPGNMAQGAQRFAGLSSIRSILGEHALAAWGMEAKEKMMFVHNTHYACALHLFKQKQKLSNKNCNFRLPVASS